MSNIKWALRLNTEKKHPKRKGGHIRQLALTLGLSRLLVLGGWPRVPSGPSCPSEHSAVSVNTPMQTNREWRKNFIYFIELRPQCRQHMLVVCKTAHSGTNCPLLPNFLLYFTLKIENPGWAARKSRTARGCQLPTPVIPKVCPCHTDSFDPGHCSSS